MPSRGVNLAVNWLFSVTSVTHDNWLAVLSNAWQLIGYCVSVALLKTETAAGTQKIHNSVSHALNSQSIVAQTANQCMRYWKRKPLLARNKKTAAGTQKIHNSVTHALNSQSIVAQTANQCMRYWENSIAIERMRSWKKFQYGYFQKRMTIDWPYIFSIRALHIRYSNACALASSSLHNTKASPSRGSQSHSTTRKQAHQGGVNLTSHSLFSLSHTMSFCECCDVTNRRV